MPDLAISPKRHALLRLRADAWSRVLADHPQHAAEPMLADWTCRLLVARRRTETDRDDRVPAGIPLPPSHGKKRLAFQLPPDAIEAIDELPSLAIVRMHAPAPWHPAIDAVLTLAQDVGGEPRVFGSFAWTALTGINYIGPESDLDLLWTLTPELDLATLLSRLPGIEATAPGRLDGEVVRHDGMAVNWRELHQAPDMVLIKATDRVMMRPTRWFLESEDPAR